MTTLSVQPQISCVALTFEMVLRRVSSVAKEKAPVFTPMRSQSGRFRSFAEDMDQYVFCRKPRFYVQPYPFSVSLVIRDFSSSPINSV